MMEQNHDLNRGFKARHMQLIAIEGSIDGIISDQCGTLIA